MRFIGGLVLSVTLASCGDSDARWKADCEASQELYAKAVAAMCSPWGEQRADALGEVLEAAHDTRFEDEVTGETIADYVSDLGAKDCIEAGFPDPGEPVVDEVRKAYRERMRERIKERMAKDNVKPIKAIKLTGRSCKLSATIEKERQSRERINEFRKSVLER